MRMRTIEQTYQYLMERDPDNRLSRYALRRMILEGRIPAVTVGTRYLIDLDRLEEFLYNQSVSQPTEGIRPVRVRR